MDKRTKEKKRRCEISLKRKMIERRKEKKNDEKKRFGYQLKGKEKKNMRKWQDQNVRAKWQKTQTETKNAREQKDSINKTFKKLQRYKLTV